jgi:hypothetical protein
MSRADDEESGKVRAGWETNSTGKNRIETEESPGKVSSPLSNSYSILPARRPFDVAAELLSHRGKHFFRKRIFLP